MYCKSLTSILQYNVTFSPGLGEIWVDFEVIIGFLMMCRKVVLGNVPCSVCTWHWYFPESLIVALWTSKYSGTEIFFQYTFLNWYGPCLKSVMLIPSYGQIKRSVKHVGFAIYIREFIFTGWKNRLDIEVSNTLIHDVWKQVPSGKQSDSTPQVSSISSPSYLFSLVNG